MITKQIFPTKTNMESENKAVDIGTQRVTRLKYSKI